MRKEEYGIKNKKGGKTNNANHKTGTETQAILDKMSTITIFV